MIEINFLWVFVRPSISQGDHIPLIKMYVFQSLNFALRLPTKVFKHIKSYTHVCTAYCFHFWVKEKIFETFQNNNIKLLKYETNKIVKIYN